MRTTQYIGLTQTAKNFVEKFGIRKDTKNATTGMFDEEIPLGEWDAKDEFRNMASFKEIEQLAPWSSGPMIFTCLEITYKNGQKGTAFEWHCDPSIMNEYDSASGGYYV